MPGFREFTCPNPQEVAVRLAQAELAQAGLNEALGRSGILFLVLKGAHLACAYYRSPSERPFCDVDVLVRPEAFAGALAALHEAGFSSLEHGGVRAATERGYYCREFRAPSGICVELHRAYAAYGRYPADAEGLFRRSRPFVLGREPARGLGPEDLLVHLCVHIAKGFFCWNEPKHLRDIAVVASAGAVDWEAFLARASEAGVRCGAHYALDAAARQCGAEIPPEVIGELAPRGIRGRWLKAHLDASAFPVYRRGSDSDGAASLRLGLPLVDRVSAWPGILWAYGTTRLRDRLGAAEG